MKIASKRRNPHFQLTIFPDAIKNMPQTRNLCGDFVEEWTAKVGHAERLTTDGTCDYCPDLIRDPLTFYETKSAGANGSVIIYEARRDKDRDFVNEGRSLIYWVWRHDTEVTGIDNVDELRRSLASSMRFAVVLPVNTIDAVAETKKLKLLNKKYTGGGAELGYGNRSKGYGYGRSIPITNLLVKCDIELIAPAANVQGTDTPPIRIFTTHDLAYLFGKYFIWQPKKRGKK